MGAGFCTWMFQYIWVVIMISNALLFNGSDWFKTFVWPLHPLVFTLSSASPFHAANNAYNHTCIKKKHILRLFGRGLSLEPEVRTTWAASRKATKPGKTKNSSKTQKTKQLLGECLVLTQTMFFFCFPSFFCCFLVLKWKTQNNIVFCFLNGYDQSRSQKTANNSSFFFQHFRFVFLHWKVSKTKITWVYLVFLDLDWLYCIHSIHFFCKKKLKLFFSVSEPKTTRENPKSESFESKPNILSKVVFFGFARVLCLFFVFLLIHMIAIYVLMLAYLICPGKSNFDQSFSLKSLRTMWD